MRTIIADGIAEDIIRAIVQTACAENHAKTILEKKEGQLENGYIDGNNKEAVDKQLEEIGDITYELNELAETRRSMMLYLMNQYDGDKDYWCMVKHLATASYCAFEAYQASEEDPELYDIYLRTNKRFTKALTHFLGVEITECAACLGDILRGKRGGTNG